MSTANPSKDQVAIVGIGTTPYQRSIASRSAASLAVEACKAALEDAGISPRDVGGICAANIPSKQVQASLGIPEVTWWCDMIGPHSFHVVEAANAVMAGACSTALVYNATYRGPNASRSAAADAFRRRNANLDAHAGDRRPEDPNGPFGYAAWAARYLAQFGVDRSVFGRIVLNDRSNAARNPHAVYRQPLTMDEYLGARMIREPLSMLDMDVPVDAGDAFILTTVDRARELTDHPVVIHASTFGRTGHAYADQLESYTETGKEIVTRRLWEKADLTLQDMDLLMAYDGFSNIAVAWIEAFGYCKTGEAADYLSDSWSEEEGRLLLDGRVVVNPHGGSLSEGGTQGAGHIREAVEQLRGSAGSERQVEKVDNILIGSGGFMWNAAGLILRRA